MYEVFPAPVWEKIKGKAWGSGPSRLPIQAAEYRAAQQAAAADERRDHIRLTSNYRQCRSRLSGRRWADCGGRRDATTLWNRCDDCRNDPSGFLRSDQASI